MNRNLFIFVGGVDNNDHTGILAMAEKGGTSRWSSTKTAAVGDRVLLYVVKPYSALIAEAKVIKSAWKGGPDDWKYLARIGSVNLLPNPLTIKELKKLLPQWKRLQFLAARPLFRKCMPIDCGSWCMKNQLKQVL